MSTERQATPPARIWVRFYKNGWSNPTVVSLSTPIPGEVGYVRADSFDTLRDALREIARLTKWGDVHTIASSALAAIDGDK